MTDVRPRPVDPVINFIYDPSIPRMILEGASWPWSRLSRSRLDKIGYRLVVLRCAQLGITPPNVTEAEAWKKR